MNMPGWIALAFALAAVLMAAFLLRRVRAQTEVLLQQQQEHSELEEKMQQQQAGQAQVIHTTKMASLGQMVAGVAHEMNTPLGFVKSNVEVVNELLDEHTQVLMKTLQGIDIVAGIDANDPDMFKAAVAQLVASRAALAGDSTLGEAQALLKDASEGLGQLRDLVLNLKGFARVDRDGMDSVDLDECVDSALNIANHQLRDRIEVRRSRSELPLVRCMPSQMNQVFLNLITNAAQAMPDGGTLTVASKVSGEHVEIIVQDTGSGIPDDVLPKIFDPFFTTKDVGEGTGLGLSIVHKIVQGHGGAIKVRTGAGKGTRFVVSLPVDRKHAAAPESGTPN